MSVQPEETGTVPVRVYREVLSYFSKYDSFSHVHNHWSTEVCHLVRLPR